MILALCFGGGMALFTSLTTLLEQILCPWGYSDVCNTYFLFNLYKKL